ncbi:MAG: HEAT repeat domain-containing protein [bacterium]
MKALQTLLVIALMAVAVPAVAQSADDLARMDGALKAIDTTPTREALDAGFADPPAVLKAAVAQTERTTYERQRALTMLSMYPTDETLAFWRTLLNDNDVEIRGLAVYSAARTFGQTPTPALISFIETALQDRDPVVKKWALRGLRWVKAPRATELLGHYASQADPALAKVAKTALRRIE